MSRNLSQRWMSTDLQRLDLDRLVATSAAVVHHQAKIGDEHEDRQNQHRCSRIGGECRGAGNQGNDHSNPLPATHTIKLRTIHARPQELEARHIRA
jgi:hypothetical protein